MKQDIENIIEKEFDLKYPDYGSDILSKAKTATEIAMAENEIFQRNKLKKFVYNIADEVLKVVVEKIENIHSGEIEEVNNSNNQELTKKYIIAWLEVYKDSLLSNLSPNKENKNNG